MSNEVLQRLPIQSVQRRGMAGRECVEWNGNPRSKSSAGMASHIFFAHKETHNQWQ